MAAVTPASVFVYDPAPKYLAEVTGYLAAGTILRGQLLSFAGTGVAWTVTPSDGIDTAALVGVALNDATVGQSVAVAGPGSVVLVQNGDDTNTMEAGDMIMADVTTALGCVKAMADTTKHYQVGVLLEAMIGGGQAYALLVMPLIAKGA